MPNVSVLAAPVTALWEEEELPKSLKPAEKVLNVLLCLFEPESLSRGNVMHIYSVGMLQVIPNTQTTRKSV